ncbi:type I restriction enzyme, S subunit [Alkalithermobacter thermoalcaliphilus JW-YL-7 = DSM 7308]|uniref:Restriction modification system DNA specificity domain-containing protein n=1 Tax=Alkalithermobacter thermoalcaliphilus JW-YL-7 = DSM 7308 TaxID=1121328 RepID=A0A150FNL4_CLOPD|nr:restriction modification system DNA specificity domain-containing protein [[Clostridium] paradoxum JW-YL-7 = DSM 7308]SHK93154.1 type I restriction enzyme, S subunit [[Clostridium] paradoxum JW-YL-7 = DSM 7308]
MKTKCKIGDLGQVVTGKTPSTSKREYYGHEYPFITPSDITGSFHVTPATYLSSEGARLLNKIMIPAKSVCYTCIASIGKICVTKEDSFTNQQINSIIVDEEKNDFRYVYYLLKFYTNHIKAIATGAATPIVNKERFSNVEVSVHKLDKQKRIADILSAYDDLIENNQKQIRLQEEAAMLLYKEWFVNLRFPGYENTKIVDGVPEGWELTTVKEMGQVITGKTPSTAIVENYGEDIPFVKIPDMHGVIYPLKTEVKLSERGANTQKNKFLPPKSIMVSCIATVGLVCITHEVCQTNQQINSIVLNDEDHLYYMFFKMKGIKSLLEGVGSNGATMTNVNKTKFENIELLKPENEILKKFNNLVEPFFSNILALSKQNEKLKEARDKLLSKLMSGEIEV